MIINTQQNIAVNLFIVSNLNYLITKASARNGEATTSFNGVMKSCLNLWEELAFVKLYPWSNRIELIHSECFMY